MDSIKELIEICEKISRGTGTNDEIACIAETAGEIFTHIDDFIETYGSEWISCPEEYFYENKSVMNGAVASFANILYEMECYVND